MTDLSCTGTTSLWQRLKRRVADAFDAIEEALFRP